MGRNGKCVDAKMKAPHTTSARKICVPLPRLARRAEPEFVAQCRSLSFRSRAAKPVIQVDGLRRVFRTYKKKPGLRGAIQGLFRREYEQTVAVKDISFTVEEGE